MNILIYNLYLIDYRNRICYDGDIWKYNCRLIRYYIIYHITFIMHNIIN